jgi:hypothetical protein
MARPSFFARLWLAIVSFFRIVFDPEFATGVAALRAPAPAFVPPKERATLPAKPSALSAAQLARAEQALQLLSMLQREGRLIDFCEEELAGFSDAQIGAAARTVHDGCRKTLREAFTLEPVRREPEGAAVELPGGFDPRAIRLTGNVMGNPPFKGVLKHHGWRVVEIHMPSASGDPTVVAPAEVELP